MIVVWQQWRIARPTLRRLGPRILADHIRCRRLPGLRFDKLLGTAGLAGERHDSTTWALLTCWSAPEYAEAFGHSATVTGWSALAAESWRLTLVPVASRGLWSRRAPFGAPGSAPGQRSGPVAAITHARLSLGRIRSFADATSSVVTGMATVPGLVTAFGIGEWPLLARGTFSVWESERSLTDFAYRNPAHTDVIRRTPSEHWYAEEIFTRFSVQASAGTTGGRDPLAGMVRA